MLDKRWRIHFIGIGGVGMSGLALILKRLGHKVTGCDIAYSKYISLLQKEGIEVFLGHSSSHLEEVDIVVYSSAISKEHPEMRSAKERGLMVLPRAKMLSQIMEAYPKSIAIAGSHGKTTTTSMIAHILMQLNLKPTAVIGGVVNYIETNSFLGEGEFLVLEADESDGSFLYYSPYIEVITNIDREHLDFYADFKAIKKAFINFILRCHPEGKVILCLDDPGIREIIEEVSGPFLFYGFSEKGEVRGKILEDSPYPLVEVFYKEKSLGTFQLSIPGKHNALNALGAIATSIVLGLPVAEVLKVLKTFPGVKRRLQFKGTYQGVLLIDDYAHHPKEMEVTFSALRSLYPDKKLLLIFQPHRYSRTKALWEDFLLVLKEPEILFLTEIYAASETPLPGISGEAFYQSVKNVRASKPTFFLTDFEEVKEVLKKLVNPEWIVLSMGAGNVYKILEDLRDEEKRDYAVA